MMRATEYIFGVSDDVLVLKEEIYDRLNQEMKLLCKNGKGPLGQ